jgi:hypothetical protein
MKSLKCIKWLKEYSKAVKETSLEDLSAEEKKNLRNLGKKLNLKHSDLPEYTALIESQEHLEIFESFQITKNLNSLDRILQLKSEDTLQKLRDLRGEVGDDQKRIQKVDQVISWAEFLKKLKHTLDVLQSGQKLPEDLFGYAKETSNLNSDGEEKGATEMEYDKMCQLIEQAESMGVPGDAYWYKVLKEKIIAFENWQKKYSDYDDWKEKYSGKMHEQLIKLKDVYTTEILRSQLVKTASFLLLPVTEDLKCITDDISAAEAWLKEASDYYNKLTYNSAILKASFTPQESSFLTTLLSKLKYLPCLPPSSTPLKILSYSLLSQADQFLKVLSKPPAEDSDSDPPLISTKLPFPKWSAMAKELKLVSHLEVVNKNQIYTMFMRAFTEAEGLWERVSKKKIKDHEEVIQKMEKSKVDFKKEIEEIRKEVEKMEKIRGELKERYRENMDLKEVLEGYEMIKDFEWGFEEEQKKFKKVVKAYETIKKKL